MNSTRPISTLIIQSPNRFAETTQKFKEVCPFPKYHVTDGVTSTTPKKTLCGNTCTILAMSNGEETYIGHFAPEYLTSNFKQKLDGIVAQFKDKTGQLTAMITGGYSRFANGNKAEVDKSFEQVALVGDVLSKHTDDITMIAGKIDPTFVDNLAVDGENFFLSHSKKLGKDAQIPQLKKNPSPQDIENALSEYYEAVELDGTPNVIFDI